jgi:transposase-like protein
MAPTTHRTTNEVAQAIAAGMPQCPICGGRNVRRSESIRFEDRIMGFLRYNPFRCRTCQHRFFKRPEQHGIPAAQAPVQSAAPMQSEPQP